MARKPKVETSPHYNEIVDLLVAGYSGRHVSKYLLDEYGEEITHTTLNKYKKDNLNVKAAVKQKIIEKEKKQKRERAQKTAEKSIEKEANKKIKANESFEIAADYRFKDIQKLDNLISDSENVRIDLNDINVDSEKYDPYKEIDLKIKLKKLGLEAMKIKYEMIDEDEIDVNIHDERIIGLSESIEKSRQEYLKEKKTK